MTGFIVNFPRLLVLSCSLLMLFTACNSSNGARSVVDVPSYRIYISSLSDYVTSGDEDSFVAGEKSQLTGLSTQILQVLGDANNFDDLDDARKDTLIALNEQLHTLMVGEDEARAGDRICKVNRQTGSNIMARSCRTRDRIAQDREAARVLLEERGNIIDQERIGFEAAGGGFGSPTLN